MSVAKRGADGFYALRLSRLLHLPFRRWKAFEHGIIDKDGNKLRDAESGEKSDWTLFHVTVRNIKQMFHKLPGGETLLNYGASYLLLVEIKEHLGLGDEFLELVNEAVVIGDSGGDPKDIAAGKTSGAITLPGPEVMGKNKKKKKKRLKKFRHFEE